MPSLLIFFCVALLACGLANYYQEITRALYRLPRQWRSWRGKYRRNGGMRGLLYRLAGMMSR